MPITRKLIQIGGSKAVTIPSSWIDNIEKERGEHIDEVLMELNGDIKIYVLPKDKKNE
jgi:antitoxin component of MazEF toxin-antitoxin module